MESYGKESIGLDMKREDSCLKSHALILKKSYRIHKTKIERLYIPDSQTTIGSQGRFLLLQDSWDLFYKAIILGPIE